MNLSTRHRHVSADVSAAIQRGLGAVGQTDATVIVSGDLVETVEWLDRPNRTTPIEGSLW